MADNALCSKSIIAALDAKGRINLSLKPLARRALLHGHCHQKAFGHAAVEAALKLVPELAVETIEFELLRHGGKLRLWRRHHRCVAQDGELSLFPALRKAAADTIVIADGTSCRQQIKDGTGRDALHVARVLAMSISQGPTA